MTPPVERRPPEPVRPPFGGALGAVLVAMAVSAFAGSCTVADKSDYTFRDGTGGAGAGQGGTAGGLQCGVSQVVCDGDCIDEDECCSSAECAEGESCVNRECQACAETCPGPQAGTGVGRCENGECTIVCDGDQLACGTDCVDVTRNGQHCGACGNACTGGLVCQDGACVDECAAGFAPCDASCVDVQTDVDHCGNCETICARPTTAGTATCEGGSCGIACDTGLNPCDGDCVDFSADEANCGACGSACNGACLEGVCCPTGHSNCDGECFDLLTSAGHCGSCAATCGAGQVCQEGRCSSDCGSLTLCGTECVDLARNPNHCQRCDNACLPPAMNGTAICAGAGGCDIQCNQQNQRCGNACCPPPPPNGNVTCGSGNLCQVQCNANHHACAGMQAPCFPDGDVQHCGTSCYDCRQPNATALCNGSRCANICDGPVTFACGDPTGKVACGTWDFESRTNEGWLIDPNGMTNAWTGVLGATQTRAVSGTTSLGFGFDGDGNTNAGGRHLIELGVSPCPSGSPVNWPARRFAFRYFVEPASGFGPPPPGQAVVYVQLRNGNQQVFGGCDTTLNAVPQWGVATCDLNDPLVITRVSLIFRIFAPWKGTIYIDRAELP